MSSGSHAIEVTKLVIEAIRVLAWPVLIAVLVMQFNKPLREIAENFSLKFSEANKVSIGSLSLEIAEKAREVGNPELARQVGSLTAGAVEQLLLTPRSGDRILISTSDYGYGGKREYGLPQQADLASLKELEEKGFVKFSKPLEPFLRELRGLPRSDRDGGSDRVWYLSKYQTDSKEDMKFREQGYSLTEKGRQAGDTIVKAVASQLSRGPT